MKKLWIIIVVMLVAFSFAMAQEIHWADQKTIEWDCPSFTRDGWPIPPDAVLATRVFLRNQDGTSERTIDEVNSVAGATEQYIVTVPVGIHELGIAAVLYYPGSTTGIISESKLWGGSTSSPFFLAFGGPPAAHSDMRVIP